MEDAIFCAYSRPPSRPEKCQRAPTNRRALSFIRRRKFLSKVADNPFRAPLVEACGVLFLTRVDKY